MAAANKRSSTFQPPSVSSRSQLIVQMALNRDNSIDESSEDDDNNTIFTIVPHPYVDSDVESDSEELPPGPMPQQVTFSHYEDINREPFNDNRKFDVLTPMEIETEDFSETIASPVTPGMQDTPSFPASNEEPLCLKVISPLVRPKKLQPPKITYTWKEAELFYTATINEDNFTIHEDVLSPLEYFKTFFDDELLLLIVENTNLYSTQTGKCVETNVAEICDFIAIQLFMGITQMHAYTDYWARKTRYDKIADIMPIKRYQTLRRNLHFVDNTQVTNDRYFKVRPLLEKVRQNCLKLEQEVKCSVDEMMIPYKGTRAGSRRQYMKGKPKKWGFKFFVRCGVSGIVYDFIPYGGEDTFRNIEFPPTEEAFGLSAKVVLALAKTIPRPACSVLYFDNFFCSPDLVYYLRNEIGVFSLGTLRSNRVRGCTLKPDKLLKKNGRGSFQQLVDNTKKVAIIKWFDNKSVILCSSYVDAYPVSSVQRYFKNSKTKNEVVCPKIVKDYNAHMGGVDLADMLVALYRTPYRAHRWYMPIFSQMLDICTNNAWLLYRRDMQLLKEDKHMSLKEFKLDIIEGLLLKNKRRVGRPTQDSEVSAKTISKPVKARPTNEVRFDSFGHFPTFTTKGRCRNCTEGQTAYFCEKCQLRLCLLKARNCFTDYHVQKTNFLDT